MKKNAVSIDFKTFFEPKHHGGRRPPEIEKPPRRHAEAAFST
ncbi:MAG: hypothetical protein ACFCUT_02205 [Kiloniellaceae bacterium]